MHAGVLTCCQSLHMLLTACMHDICLTKWPSCLCCYMPPFPDVDGRHYGNTTCGTDFTCHIQAGMAYTSAINHMRLAHTDSGIVTAPRGNFAPNGTASEGSYVHMVV